MEFETDITFQTESHVFTNYIQNPNLRIRDVCKYTVAIQQPYRDVIINVDKYYD